ncbi:MAG: energy transducer TonB, partial [Candidatus Acidiferrales bacterium]
AGLYHSVFATQIRCHTVIFSITAGGAETLANVAESLKKMSFSQATQSPDSSGAASTKAWPLCLSDTEYSRYIVRRTVPAMIGPRFGSVPVRLLIGPEGKIEHVHAIAGVPEQIKSVEDALAKWEFKPYLLDGQPVEVETGILFQFPQPPPHSSGVR